MSIQAEIVTQGTANGPGLPPHPNGLPAVNQSPAAAQHAQYAASGYGSYPAVVSTAYGSPYPAAVNSNSSSLAPAASAYYAQTAQRTDQPFPDSELRYTQQVQQQHAQDPHPQPMSPPPPPPPPVAGPSKSNGKRKEKAPAAGSGDEGAPPAKKRRAPRTAAAAKDAENADDDDVGPGGGAKHWTVDEKTRLFRWILEDDERWAQFGSKMNVIFREGSERLFASRKSFTALKSCYHRNLDVFKQIWLFEAFLARPPPADPANLPSPGTPSSSTSAREVSDALHAPLPAAFDTPQERQTFLDKKLDAARLCDVPVANLSVKAIDNWLVRGWFAMFKRRFKEDPKTGLPVPSHDGLGPGWCIIPPPLNRPAADDDQAPQANGDGDGDGEPDPDVPQSPHTDAQRASVVPHPGGTPYNSLSFPNTPKPAMSRAQQQQQPTSPPAGPTNGHTVPAPRLPTQQHQHHAHAQPPYAPAPLSSHARSHSQPQPQSQTRSHASPQLPTTTSYTYPQPPASAASAPFYPSPPAEYAANPIAQQQQQQQQQAAHFQAQTLQALTHLASVTQTLLGTCTTLTELVRAQVEDSKARTELLRRREERDVVEHGGPTRNGGQGVPEALGRTQKATLAMELLSNPGVGDEIKNAAADYLKKLFQ